MRYLQNLVYSGNTPAFCVCLGDIADHGYESEFDDYVAFTSKIDTILGTEEGKTKVYNVLGNHDLYNSGWIYYSQKIFPYKSFYHFNTKKFSWYVIDSASDTLGHHQLELLKTSLEQDSNPKIILGHVPIYGDPFFSFAYFSFQDEHESSLLLSLFANENVKLVMEGHSHCYWQNDFNTFIEYIVSSVTAGKTGSEWTLLTIDEEAESIETERIFAKDWE